MNNKQIRQIKAEVHAIGGYRILNTVSDLADCLLDRWPVTEGGAFVAAMQACHESLEGRGDANDAREAFITAARDAGVSVLPNDAG
jgi:hypothetical protein